jgi:hypothetical protein
MNWKDRIVAYDKVSPDALIANVMNYRKHPAAQRRALLSVINDVGFVQPVVVNVNTKNIIDGHLRVELAKEQKVSEISVIYVNVDEMEEKKLLSTIDPITNMAIIDHQMFDELLKQVATTEAVVNDMWDSIKRDMPKPTEAKTILSEAPVVVEWEAHSVRDAFTPKETEKYLQASIRTISFYIKNEEYEQILRKMDALLPKYEVESYQELFSMLVEEAYASSSH